MRLRVLSLLGAREVRDALRSRWFLIAAASFLALSLALSALGLAGSMRSGLAGYDRTTAGLLNLALLFVPLVGLSLGALGIAGELEDGSLAVLLAQPVTRGEVFFAKFGGTLAALCASVLVGFGISGALIGLLAPGGRAGAFLALAALIMLLAAVSLALGTALSVAFRTRARVVGASFAAWMVLVYGADLGSIGLTIAQRLSPAQTFALALVNPVQEVRILGTLVLSQRLDVLGPAGIFGLDQLGERGVVALLVASLTGLTSVALAVSYARFRRLPVT